jgi:polar amino acid transport system substrate-binding protein
MGRNVSRGRLPRGLCLPLLAVWLLGGPAAADPPDEPVEAAVPQLIRACDDAAEFPPLVFYRRDGGRMGEPVTGYAVDLIEAALGRDGRQLTTSLLPWKRCLELAAAGRYDVVLSAARTGEREAQFEFTSPYFDLDAIFVYDRLRPPQDGSTVAGMARLTLCGSFGYVYPDVQNFKSVVTEGGKTFDALLGMLRAGRCDVLVTNTEFLAGRSLLERRDVVPPDQFGTFRLDDAEPQPISVMVSRALPYADALVGLIDRDLAELKRTGEADRLLAPYRTPARYQGGG